MCLIVSRAVGGIYCTKLLSHQFYGMQGMQCFQNHPEEYGKYADDEEEERKGQQQQESSDPETNNGAPANTSLSPPAAE